MATLSQRVFDRVVAAIGQELPDILHMGARLVLGRQLLEGDKGRRQRFDDDPFVVTRNSLSRHRLTLNVVARGDLLTPKGP